MTFKGFIYKMQTFSAATRFACAPMTLVDLAFVAALEVQAFPAPRSRAFYAQEITQNQYANYLVLHVVDPLAPALPEGGLPVAAYGGYWLLGEDAHVVSIAVDSLWQRRGLAAWLMLELSATAWQQAALRVTLEMRVGNQAAAALYHKLGFQAVGRRKRYYRDNNEDALLLSLENLQDTATQQELTTQLLGLRERFGDPSLWRGPQQ